MTKYLSEINLVFAVIFIGAGILLSGIIIFTQNAIELLFIGFSMVFGGSCYFYYRMDHPCPFLRNQQV